jgi:hypothetical protein
VSGQCDPAFEAAQHADRGDWAVSGDQHRPSRGRQEKSSVELINYSSEAELIQAAERGEIYVRGAFQDDRDPSLNRGALWKGEEHRGDQVAAEQRGQLLRNARCYVSRTLRQDVPLIGTRDGAHV